MIRAPDARIALRARGVLESADLGLRFFAAHAGMIFRLSAVLLVPAFAASLTMRYVLGLDWVTTWFAAAAVAWLLEGPFTLLAGQLALRKGVRLGDALQPFSRRALSFMLVLLASVVAQLVSAAMLLVPWLFVAPSQVFLPEVVLLEGSGFGAFRRAARMTSGQSGRALGLTLVLMLVRLAMIVLGDAALRRSAGMLLDVHASVESLWSDGGSPYALFGLWLSVPFVATLRYIAYIDFRTIREGWDLQRRFQVLASRLAEEAAA
jgi:hypothetical protein